MYSRNCNNEKRKQKTDPFEDQKNWITEKIQILKTEDIGKICVFLEIKSDFLLRILKEENLTLENKISKEKFKSIEDYIRNRLKIIYRKNKLETIDANKQLKYRKKYSNISNNVYSKLKLHGLGKLIYIRSK